jgi:hypothetical protein
MPSERTGPESLFPPSKPELLKSGGEWLGAARTWLQWNTRNGSSVTWGSRDWIDKAFTVVEIEDLAADVAAATMRETAARVTTLEAEVRRLREVEKVVRRYGETRATLEGEGCSVSDHVEAEERLCEVADELAKRSFAGDSPGSVKL